MGGRGVSKAEVRCDHNAGPGPNSLGRRRRRQWPNADRRHAISAPWNRCSQTHLWAKVVHTTIICLPVCVHGGRSAVETSGSRALFVVATQRWGRRAGGGGGGGPWRAMISQSLAHLAPPADDPDTPPSLPLSPSRLSSSAFSPPPPPPPSPCLSFFAHDSRQDLSFAGRLVVAVLRS